MKKITRTFTRTQETMDRYIRENKEREEKGIEVEIFKNWKDHLIKEFTHWVIIDNEYPYDAIAELSHMLAPKREVPFNWDLLNESEVKELNDIRDNYINEYYDVLWENLPKMQTQPKHFHLHLLKLKREEN